MATVNKFGDVGKVAGDMTPPVKQGGGVQGGGYIKPSFSSAPTPGPQVGGFGDARRQAPQMPQMPAAPQAPTGNMGGQAPQQGGGLGLGAVPDFNQRKANAMALYGPQPAQGAPGGMPGTGGGFMAPGPPQQADPYDPQGGFGAGAGQGMGQGRQPMGPPPGGQGDFDFQRMFQNPQFMQMLMQYMHQARGGQMGMPQMQAAPSTPPPPGGGYPR